MKLIKYIIPLFLILTMISCSDDDSDLDPIDEVEGLLKVQELANETHTIELYNERGFLLQGYNNITMRIKDKVSSEFIQNASITWNPLMHMTMKTHSCPKSDLTKVGGMETTYSGYIVFQMPENDDEGWDLTIDYTINGESFEVRADISVQASDRKSVSVFTGSDDTKYIIALIDPNKPEVAMNDLTVGLFKMENMMSFPIVDNYMIKLDPRMPSMGNHSSPNNQDLAYNGLTEMYDGNLSLTMSGYWKLNLMLYNSDNELLKGEEVTDLNESSSLFLELEF